MSIVELIYAKLEEQKIMEVPYKIGNTINDVITSSGILEKYPEIDLSINKVGIYNQVKKLDDIVQKNDRIEIYRPLIANPKDVRRKRALQQKQEGII